MGSLLVSGLNYLYYPILGRLMPTAQFGEVQALVSLFLQATIFFTVVTNVAVNVVTNEGDQARRNRIVYELEHAATLVTLVVLVIMLIFVRPLQQFLQFEEVGPFLMLAAALMVGAPLASRNAYLRGRLAFGTLSLANAAGSLAKIVFSAAFVIVGWRTTGALGGVVAAQLVALVYTANRARRLGLASPPGLKLWRWPDVAIIRPQLRYSALVLVVSLVITTLFSFDVIVVKHYFSAEVAGLYAGVATVARIVFFVTASVAAVLLATVKLESPAPANRRLLVRSIWLHTAAGGAVLLTFTLAPQLVVRLLIGAKYLAYAHLLPMLALALFGLAFVNLLFNYDLALRRASAAAVAIGGAVLMGAIISLHHNSIEAVVESLLWGAVGILILRGLDSVRRRY